VWRTVYLPLSFVITGLFGDPSCYAHAPYDARDCDPLGIVFILLMYVGCVVSASLAFFKRDRRTAIYRSVAIAVGGPLLFALERGNLIMLSMIAFFLLYGGLLQDRRWFAMAAGFATNLKIYMLFPLGALAVKRDWRLLELCGLA